MKRILAVLITLIFASCFCACGNQNASSKTDKNTPSTNENAIQTETESTNNTEKTIAITLDNWQEYFEIEEIKNVTKNVFGEVEAVNFENYIVLKSNYAIVENKTNIDLKVTYETSYHFYKFDESTEDIELMNMGVPATKNDNVVHVSSKKTRVDKNVWTGEYIKGSGPNQLSYNTKLFVERIQGTLTITQ